ncbi:hypothetical protein ULMA_04790 [Patiriisocius marinus]|uniref:Secretion system C-terminal sorting domain-containing protein n=1 Tax=Patiriisocius marinus TaxID=1397112 RepID=A0A5J4IXS6_9FLAO|nr:T9SS type A sorting domain-containing protein [Patiriisocius marinus]GER58371.1 hypothetical protein ULMA_04790 [Patiriisocius marinus]
MKNIMILVFVCFFSFISSAQEPDLVNTIWYLREINIGGTVIVSPSNNEIETPKLEYLSTGNGYFLETCVCICWGGDVLFDTGFFLLPNGLVSITQETCSIQENIDFDNIYFDQIFQHETNAVSDPIEYEILTDSDGNKQLTLTNSNGDVAVYGDQLLGVEDNRLPTFTIASNPVQNTLSLVLPESLKNSSIELYDIRGKLQISKTSTNTTVATDVSNLTNGVYLVVVTNSVTKSIKKFIKE